MKLKRASFPPSKMHCLGVTLFRGFAEDRRWSMEVFANNLCASLEAVAGRQLCLKEYRPTVSPFRGTSLVEMRLARFVGYPIQAVRQGNQVNHILDHAYGHLLYALNPAHTVVTVHDVHPLVRWRGRISGVARGHYPWLNAFAFHALRRAAHIVTDSENTRRDLLELCQCEPDRVTVVPLGIAPIFRPFSHAEKFVLPRDGVKRVLITGSQFYKNRTGAVRIFARLLKLASFPLELISVGNQTPEWVNVVKQNNLEAHVRCIQVKKHDEMAALYNSVDCLLFPSLYEGFGLPLLEAMACGLPVVTSNAGSIPETVGGAAMTFQPDDEEGFTQALFRVLTDDSWRGTLVERGLRHVKQFTWERTARETLEIYRRILELS